MRTATALIAFDSRDTMNTHTHTHTQTIAPVLCVGERYIFRCCRTGLVVTRRPRFNSATSKESGATHILSRLIIIRREFGWLCSFSSYPSSTRGTIKCSFLKGGGIWFESPYSSAAGIQSILISTQVLYF